MASTATSSQFATKLNSRSLPAYVLTALAFVYIVVVNIYCIISTFTSCCYPALESQECQ